MREQIEMRLVHEFPGYRVTSDGRVQSRWRRGVATTWARYWRDLSPSVDTKGYLGLTICNERGRRKVRVHRLIAETFIANPDALPCVRHLDGDPANNHVTNLAWGTYADNEQDKRAHGTWDARRDGGKLTPKTRATAFRLREQGETHASIATAIGVSRPTIGRLLNGKTWAGVS